MLNRPNLSTSRCVRDTSTPLLTSQAAFLRYSSEADASVLDQMPSVGTTSESLENGFFSMMRWGKRKGRNVIYIRERRSAPVGDVAGESID